MRIGYTAIDMRLGGKIYDIIDFPAGKNIRDQFGIGNIASHKLHSRIFQLFFYGSEISGICQFIENNDGYIIVFLQHVFYEIRTDKTGCTGYQICFHRLNHKFRAQDTYFLAIRHFLQYQSFFKTRRIPTNE